MAEQELNPDSPDIKEHSLRLRPDHQLKSSSTQQLPRRTPPLNPDSDEADDQQHRRPLSGSTSVSHLESPPPPHSSPPGTPRPAITDQTLAPSGSHKPSRQWLSWWTEKLSPVAWLENKASVARDHLANERTFLAWFRTSLSLTSIGIALAQLSRISDQIKINEINKLMTYIRPFTEPLYSLPTPTLQLASASDNPTPEQKQSLEFLLRQINLNLINLNTSLNRINDSNSKNHLRNLATLIGNCYVVLGLLFLFIGTYRYLKVQKVLQIGKFPQSRISIVLITIVVTGLLIFTIVGMFKSGL